MSKKKSGSNAWVPSYRERLAGTLARLLEERLNRWYAEIERHHEHGDDAGAAVLKSCLREIERDIEDARIAAAPTPRPEVRSLKEWAEAQQPTQRT